jgi:hypothetical protein
MSLLLIEFMKIVRNETLRAQCTIENAVILGLETDWQVHI